MECGLTRFLSTMLFFFNNHTLRGCAANRITSFDFFSAGIFFEMRLRYKVQVFVDIEPRPPVLFVLSIGTGSLFS